jgi:hypothetical protein
VGERVEKGIGRSTRKLNPGWMMPGGPAMNSFEPYGPPVGWSAAKEAAMAGTDNAPTRSAWAGGVSFFGGVIMATVGLLQFFEGISAVVNDKVFAATPTYVYKFDLTLWGWFHLILGAIAVVVGVAIMASQPWAFFTGIFLAALSVIIQFLFVPYYPLWALTIIAIDFAVIWALCRRLHEDWTIP